MLLIDLTPILRISLSGIGAGTNGSTTRKCTSRYLSPTSLSCSHRYYLSCAPPLLLTLRMPGAFLTMRTTHKLVATASTMAGPQIMRLYGHLRHMRGSYMPVWGHLPTMRKCGHGMVAVGQRLVAMGSMIAGTVRTKKSIPCESTMVSSTPDSGTDRVMLRCGVMTESRGC